MSVTIPSDLVAGALAATKPHSLKDANLKLAVETVRLDFLATLVSVNGTAAGPHDLVMDVLNAADPARAGSAEKRLAGLGGTRLVADAKPQADACQQFEAFL